ncbi:MAG: peptidase, partial [Natronospirillum sp.]|nr:peptidase [Natronospirillum sp.]
RFRVTWPAAGASAKEAQAAKEAKAAGGSPDRAATALGAIALTGASARHAIASIGQPGSDHLAYARRTLQALPDELQEAAHQPYAARALMYALLLSQDTDIRTQQLEALEKEALPDVYRELMRLASTVLLLDDRLRLPLVELAIPALKTLSGKQVEIFRRCLGLLIKADGKVSLFEWALFQILQHNLREQSPGVSTLTLKDCRKECAVLLNVLAQAGQDNERDVRSALKTAEKELPFALARLSAEQCGIATLNRAMGKLRRLKPLQKPALLKAMARTIEHSGTVRPAEAEVFRAVGEILDCPMPPLLEESF